MRVAGTVFARSSAAALALLIGGGLFLLAVLNG
jgi:hypothetical protein